MVLFLITMFLNVSLNSNFLILIGDLSFMAFLNGVTFSGEKQIAFIICLSVWSWHVTYFEDPLFCAVTPCT